MPITHTDPGVILTYGEYVGAGSHAGIPTTLADLVTDYQRIVRRPFNWHIFKDGATYYALNCRTQQIPYSDADAYEVFQDVFDNMTAGDAVFIERGDYNVSQTPNCIKQMSIIQGEGLASKIIPAAGEYGLKLGDGSTDAQRIEVRDLRIQPGSVGNANGIHVDKVHDFKADNLLIADTATGMYIKNSSRTLISRSQVIVFTSKGIHYPTPTSIPIADQCIDRLVMDCDVNGAAAVGIQVDHGVNGIRINDALISGANKTGLDKGIWITGSYSGVLLNQVILDLIKGDGMVLNTTATYQVTQVQAMNSWFQSCGGHGLRMEGVSTAKPVDWITINNCVFLNNDYSGMYMKNVEYSFFNNCVFNNNAQENLAANEYMTNLYIEDKAGIINFDHCYFGWITAFANRVKPVNIRAVNGSHCTVKFSGCMVRDPGADNRARIGWYKAVGGSTMYLYSSDVMNNYFGFVAGPDTWADEGVFFKNAGSQAVDVGELYDSKVGKAFGW